MDNYNYGGQNYDKREQSKTGQVSVEPRLGSIGSNRNRSWRKLRSGINFYHRGKEKKRFVVYRNMNTLNLFNSVVKIILSRGFPCQKEKSVIIQ